MTGVPAVLGLNERDALHRLKAMGFGAIDVRVSGRRREGTPRVIRQKEAGDTVELVVSYIKVFAELPLSPSGDIPLKEGDK